MIPIPDSLRRSFIPSNLLDGQDCQSNDGPSSQECGDKIETIVTPILTAKGMVTISIPKPTSISSEPPTLARIAPELHVISSPEPVLTIITETVFLDRPSSSSSLPISTFVSTTDLPSATPAAAQPTHSSDAAVHSSRIQPSTIVAIILGGLFFLGFAVAILLVVRRFYRMYRHERVLRKQAQTIGNAMPFMTGTAPAVSGAGGKDTTAPPTYSQAWV